MSGFLQQWLKVFVFWLAATAATASVCEAQRGTSQFGWTCLADNISNPRPCKNAECDAMWDDHLRTYHSGGSQPTQRPLSRPTTLTGAYVRGLTSMTTLGVLGASLATDSAGVNQWSKGLVGGPAAGIALTTAINAKSIPAAVGVPLTAAAGYVATKTVTDIMTERGVMMSTDAKKVNLAGMAVPPLAFVGFKAAQKLLGPRWIGPPQRVRIVASGRYLGGIIRW